MERIDCFKLFGVKVNVVNMKDTVNYIISNLDELKGKYICVSNVHTTMMSYENNHYRNIQNSSVLSLPDGKPLAILGKLKGFKKIERVVGPELMDEIFKKSEYDGITHYFYGSTEETLAKLRKKLNERYPKLNVVGMYSPPFRPITPEEDKLIVDNINNCNPNVIWVGLGAPKQEIWMHEHLGKITALMIGVGAGFNYHADEIKRAPKLFQSLSLEWLYRLFQDPKRLWKRYFYYNTKFLIIGIKSLIIKLLKN
jgi:N-acetylglucosaminyldiphosphoundecaprenol N-acetyl-beta-D-mannosaminyltransferase